MDTQQLNGSIAAYVQSHPWIILLMIWVIVWKMIALWKAAKRDHLTLFIILFVLNFVGIPEIIYITYLYFKEKK